jgi:hypothetical protein
LRHLDDDFTSWQSAMRDRETSPAAPKASTLPPEMEREVVRKFLDEHYTKWLDMPLPALDGQTPREAVATANGRERVVELLKSLENSEAPVSKLKAALGVEF